MEDTIIIVEGPQGAGKTTFTNFLREHMPATDLYRLTGIKDKTKTAGFEKTSNRYFALLDYMNKCTDVNMVFDRTFFTDEIYSRLGFKEYSFTETYNELLERLDKLNFKIYFVVLYLEDEKLYETRIKRDKHQYQKFEVESSIKQQREYLKMADEISKTTKNIEVIKFANDTKGKFELQVNKYFGHLFK
jgi:thymidylate kinase